VKTPEQWLEAGNDDVTYPETLEGALKFIADIQRDAREELEKACVQKHAALVKVVEICEMTVSDGSPRPVKRPAWIEEALAASCGWKAVA